jgi:sigma-B regulation protein RsbU (phosphoserine phosphatase)
VTLNILHVAAIAVAYTMLLFLVAWYARRRSEQGRSLVNNPIVYSLSIAVYCTSWTFYGSVGKAATSGIDFLMIYLGPSLVAFSWFYILRRLIRISKENNISSIADLISMRYGNSQLLGSLITLIAMLGIMPYIALQIKAVVTSFALVSGVTDSTVFLPGSYSSVALPTGFALALILSIFGVIFGARRLPSSERHEGLIAAVAFESIIKLISLVGVGIFVTWYLFDGFSDILQRFQTQQPELLKQLFTLNTSREGDVINGRYSSATTSVSCHGSRECRYSSRQSGDVAFSNLSLCDQPFYYADRLGWHSANRKFCRCRLFCYQHPSHGREQNNCLTGFSGRAFRCCRNGHG